MNKRHYIKISRDMYPPFCIHFYKESVGDFPFISPKFDTIEEALNYGSKHFMDYKVARLGYWTGLKNSDKYFYLMDLDLQYSIF